MKTNPVVIILFIAMAALGFWVSRIDASLSTANEEIAALNKKLISAQHDASVARSQSAQPKVELAGGPAASGNGSRVVNERIKPDPQALVAQAQQMTPGPERDSAMYVAIMATASTDPQGAWNLAQSLPDDGSDRRAQTLRRILIALSDTDPAQAAALLMAGSLAETSNSATNAIGTIETNWLKKDPEAAVKWVDVLPSGGRRDSAIQAIIAAAQQENNLAAAVAWVDKMDDVNRRAGIINSLIREWAKTDPEAATKAVLARPNKNNGRQEALLALINETVAKSAAANSTAAAGGSAPAQ